MAKIEILGILGIRFQIRFPNFLLYCIALCGSYGPKKKRGNRKTLTCGERMFIERKSSMKNKTRKRGRENTRVF